MESDNSLYLTVTDCLYLIQNAFPTLIGLMILAAYYYFGAHSAEIICAMENVEGIDDDTTV